MVKNTRCSWSEADPALMLYHDTEWGRPEKNSGTLFEQLILELMQAGLSWRTVLKKRETMRAAFLGFDPSQLAFMGPQQVDDWMRDSGVIRNRIKLEAVIQNARVYLEVPDFSQLIWSFVDGKPLDNPWPSVDDVPVLDPISERMAGELKKLGFKFIGPITCYSFMQSAGLVNDHVSNCITRCEQALC